tara:strand:- start:88 stop:555 length:468 start_codon:yes stop_codon:yes gene_type:complete
VNNLSITAFFSLFLSILSAQAADFWLSERIAILGSFAGLQYSLNPGIAWGIRLPAGLQEVLIFLALVCVGYLGFQACKPVSSIKYFVLCMRQVAFGSILGGGIANVIDRFIDGYVTDYVQIGSFPIFNVADSFVTIGVVLLLFEAVYTKYIIHNT